MPELPEVETTRLGLLPHVQGRRVINVIQRRADLRWPIALEIQTRLPGLTINAIRRRAKYLLLDTDQGSVIVHLGMSGSLRVLPKQTPVRAHDHLDIELDNGTVLRMNDPRRFGAVLWQSLQEEHVLLRALGPEPLSEDFTGEYLFEHSRQRKAPVKTFLMDQHIVVGVGNIYAAEALYAARISPLRAAGKIALPRYRALATEVKSILQYAISRGGTTLRDFISPDGLPGYFEQELSVYGRDGLACLNCGRPLKHAVIGQRATVWCSHCQR